MARLEYYNFHHRQTRSTEDDRRLSLPSTISISSDSSHSTLSSAILAMCPQQKDLNDYLENNDDSSLSKTDQIRCTTEDISLCKLCKKPNSSNQSDTCLECQLTISSDSESIISTSQSIIQTENRRREIVVSTQKKSRRKLSYNLMMRLLHRHQQSTSDALSQSYLYLLVVHPTLSNVSNSEEPIISPPLPLPAPPSPAVSISLSEERIKYYKQRESELGRVIQQLIENLTAKTNENINQLLKHWSYLKQLCLGQFYPQISHRGFFNYILKFPYSNKQSEVYFQENDELQARLHILLTILTVIQDKYSYSKMNQLFMDEEKLMSESLQHQLDFLVSSYSDETSFIRERSQYYQSSSNGEKNFDWIQIINKDYPTLIERISDDFVSKVPQIEQILIQMLRNMKKRLLDIETINGSNLR